MDLHEIRKKIKKEMDKERYEHTKGVMYTAGCLAMAYEYPVEKAMLAGLLHDCAKCIPNKKKLKMCSQSNISVTPFEEAHPFLLHAKLGAYVAGKKYDIRDPEILSSITWHTTGKPDMSVLEKIVYIADYIEPRRDKAPNLPQVRALAFRDLDECMYMILRDTLSYLGSNPKDIDSTTQEAFSYYNDLHTKKKQTAERSSSDE